jgi:hypothetical protein
MSIATTTDLEEVFLSLAWRWKEERGPSSSTTELAMCPSYQRIIGLGPAVLPFLCASWNESRITGSGH